MEIQRYAARTEIVDAAQSQLRALAHLEPDNGAWPYLLCYCSFARLDVDRGLRYVEEAATKPRFSLHHKEEMEAAVNAYTGLAIPRPEAILFLETYFVFPELEAMRQVAKAARGQADTLEATGKLPQAIRARLAVIDVGWLMAREEEYLLTALVARAVADMGYGYNDAAEEAVPFASGDEYEAVKLRRAIFRQEAFLSLLARAGLGHLKTRYAQGLEETVRYTAATHEYVQSAAGDWRTRAYVGLGAGYLAPRLCWQALACTVALLALAAIVSVFVRRKSQPPSGRTVVGVSIVGAVACLATLAVCGFLMRLWMYGVIAMFESNSLGTIDGSG